MFIISNDVVIPIDELIKIVLDSRFELLVNYTNIEQVEVANYLRTIFKNSKIDILDIKLDKTCSYLIITYYNHHINCKHKIEYKRD